MPFGISKFVPEGAAAVKEILRMRGQTFTEETIETSWTWQGSVAEAAEDLDARVRLAGREPMPGLSKEVLRERFPDNRVVMTTHASEGVIIWRRN